MTLDTSIHKNIMLQILKDIYSDTTIAPFLVRKNERPQNPKRYWRAA